MRALLRNIALCASVALSPPAAWAHGDDDVHGAPAAVPAGANPYPLGDLAARFKVSFQPVGARKGSSAQIQTWTLARSADRITLIKGAIEEIWSRDAQGQIGLSRIFRDDRHVVDYSAGELKTLGVLPRWETIGTLFDEAAIRYLKPGGVTRLAGREVYRFSGKLGAERIELAWDAKSRLPARLVRTGPNGRVQFDLLQTQATAPAEWQPAGAESATFQRIDAADFGDMESNPFVRKAQAYDVRIGWRQAHTH